LLLYDVNNQPSNNQTINILPNSVHSNSFRIKPLQKILPLQTQHSRHHQTKK